MGFRTVVMLSNDRHAEWSKDPNLGSDITRAMNFAGQPYSPDQHRTDYLRHGYGRVVECHHASTITMAKLSNNDWYQPQAYRSQDIARSINETEEATNLLLLKQAAEKLGYRLVKKS